MVEDSVTLFTGRHLIRLTEVPSTNRYAAELLSKTTPSEGTCIITDFQTDGQGQIGRYWFSDKNINITASYIFYPVFLKATAQFELSIMTALAVLEVIQSIGIRNASVKWPNDIYIGDKKVAGILIQNQLQGSLIKSTIIGIGLNVNQEFFPQNIPNPTSLYLESGHFFDITTIINGLHKTLEQNYLSLKSGRFLTIRSKYLGHLYRKDEWHIFSDSRGRRFRASIKDVATDGALVMELESGEQVSYNFREVGFIIDDDSRRNI